MIASPHARDDSLPDDGFVDGTDSFRVETYPHREHEPVDGRPDLSDLERHVLFREPPKNDVEWNKAKLSALALAESANLLMAPERAYDDERWMDGAKLLLDVGRKAYKAAQAHDDKAIEDLNQELNDACVTCHMHYRANYGRRPVGAAKQK